MWTISSPTDLNQKQRYIAYQDVLRFLDFHWSPDNATISCFSLSSPRLYVRLRSNAFVARHTIREGEGVIYSGQPVSRTRSSTVASLFTSLLSARKRKLRGITCYFGARLNQTHISRVPLSCHESEAAGQPVSTCSKGTLACRFCA